MRWAFVKRQELRWWVWNKLNNRKLYQRVNKAQKKFEKEK